MNVYIKDYKQIKFGEYTSESFKGMLDRLFLGIEQRSYEAVVAVSSFSTELYNINDLALEIKERYLIHCPNTYSFKNPVDAMDAAFKFVSNGIYKNTLVVGADKFSQLTNSELEETLANLLPNTEAEVGQTFFGRLALLQNYYIQKGLVTNDELYDIAARNTANGVSNEFAQFQREFSASQVAESPMVADPLRLLETAAFCDGACSLVLSSAKSDIEIDNFTQVKGKREVDIDFSIFDQIKEMRKEFKDYNLYELSDTTSFIQYIIQEKLGIRSKKINLSGGFKSCGNPIGASPLRQIIDLAKFMKRDKYEKGLSVYLNGTCESLGITSLKYD